NLIKALPPTCSILTDVAMVANFAHRQGIMKGLIEPLFKHLDLLGYSYQAFGDNIWQLAGLNYNGPLSNDNVKLSRVYGTAKVCPNVHTEKQVATQAYINDRSFMIPLCGGVQVSDNPLAIKYLGGNCEVATSTTDFMNRVVGLVKDHPNRSSHIMSNANYVANRHTYFNRLSSIFHILGLHELSKEVDTKGQVAAVRHCFELGAILDAAERGVSYGQKEIIGIA
ncbi:hypothetical protein KAR91_73460, partial [Candidatus Pacearchaeota archaeon]|nr:hypothetical protein [Candidatus Pacearchaeota archaeon]